MEWRRSSALVLFALVFVAHLRIRRAPLLSESISSEVSPWKVSGGSTIDYDRIISQFGCKELSPPLLKRMEEVTKLKLPPFLRRGFGVSHRDLDKLLDQYEKGSNFYVYTGRGASSQSMHLGHLLPFLLTKWFQEAFNAFVVIQLTDDEKYLWKDLSLPQAQSLAWENIKDIIALGFDPERTVIFRNTDQIATLYPNALRIQKHITLNQVSATLGLNGSDSIGKFAFPALQIAPAFASTFPASIQKKISSMESSKELPFPLSKAGSLPLCLVPCAVDQDPFFRLARDVAHVLDAPKPVLLHTRFLPSLRGIGTKASSSENNSCILLSDSPATLKTKMNKYAFSGGQATAKLQRELGAETSVDIAYQYLRYFHPNDTKVKILGEQYKNGEILSGQIKQEAIRVLSDILSDFQSKRARVSDQDVIKFMRFE
mmetsp:Transcript_24009/g.33575  ORF Transcript_24009/g.33575 Transcript_24009/m.33575 type:complete len:429 (-) Transcript_24009:393-1679(-)|eukprot:CAMPEP_0185261682 /NCGR_PEP_ID=MMETSP1359-20130426/10025_1 /TAXON_ID=552665 /ORGANISM="Bigelowiella longifila, Strain CCMP242" /LENGTH=428 /DNA_ID=CAMNT_0027848391 /DNA_START=51 /DNA_END=1337 /DNA_ORIENTATION=+